MQFSNNTSRRLLAVLALVSSGMAAAEIVILPGNDSFADNYIGAAASGTNPSPVNSDVIGLKSKFDIFSLTASLTGTALSVQIETNFVGEAGVYPSLTHNTTGIGYGDLFLSSTWTPEGDAPYYGDNAANTPTTLWEYGLALDGGIISADANRYKDAGGSATLYSLGSGNNVTDIVMSDAFISTNGYRHGQAVAVNTGSSGTAVIGAAGAQSWLVDESLNRVSFQIDLAGTNLLSGDKIAFHWAMTCANDVIEGYVPLGSTTTGLETPIPAAAWLFGSAIAGFFGFTRRRKLTA